jgi:hypothetical protein
VKLTRQHVVDVLRTAGLPEIADEAERELPEEMDEEEVAAWTASHGANMSQLISRMGGSP